MKWKILLIALLFLGFNSLQAQNFFLPVSTDSEAAKKAYQDAVMSTQHASLSSYNSLMNSALEMDREFFMAHAHKALGSLNRQDDFRESASKAMAISQEKLNKKWKSKIGFRL